ncbi:uncharacterized protein LOC107646361 [Arachis ipaensis]|uniref:uncharacterized protein LOC107646361 n=1 Tax=Arachis ipaensis TaxID=130454 RepID=UPI000A2B2223|nr:uncharacterized protein LOC107646361 [Arachis ipaensis]
MHANVPNIHDLDVNEYVLAFLKKKKKERRKRRSPTPIHSSADVEGRNHHRVLLLAEPASSLPSPNVPELAEPASSFAVAERRRARQLVGASPTPRPHSPPRVLRFPSSSSKMWAVRCLPLKNRVLRAYCSKATWVVEDDSGTSKRMSNTLPSLHAS